MPTIHEQSYHIRYEIRYLEKIIMNEVIRPIRSDGQKGHTVVVSVWWVVVYAKLRVSGTKLRVVLTLRLNNMWTRGCYKYS